MACPFCGLDPYDYIHNGLGLQPIAVTCCDGGVALFQYGMDYGKILEMLGIEEEESNDGES